jgi:hypothetical protein
VANIHATNNPVLARVEVGLAADFLVETEQCILCGDFNVHALAVPDFTPPIDGIDQILAKGLEFARLPEAWPDDRRRMDGLLLSDHALVEAEVAWT